MSQPPQFPDDLSHRLRLLNILDRIAQISLTQESMEEVLGKVLDLMLEEFQADRAWFLYPCDPHAHAWRVPIERTRPEWPGLGALGEEVAMTDDVAKIFAELLQAKGTIQYGPNTGHPNPPTVVENFFVKTQLQIALRPKIGNAWVFGLHHCAGEVMHDAQDLQLFTAVAQRISDSLSSMISIRRHRESEEQLRAFLDNSAVIGWLKDKEGRYVFASDNFLKRFGFSDDVVIGKTEHEIWPPAIAAELYQNDLTLLAQGGPLEVVEARKNSDDSISWWLSNKFTYKNSVGKQLLGGLAVDITERKQAEQQLQIAAIAFEAQEGIVITDTQGVILRVNRAFTQITGYTAEEVIGKNPRHLISDRHDANFYTQIWKDIQYGGSWDGEIWSRRKSGEIYPERLTITAVRDVIGNITHYVATITDFTMSKEVADEIKNLAFYDSLTGQPNRRLLLDRLSQALASSARSGRRGALLFIDLDNFKMLNDTLGHNIGDLLLRQVAQRLSSCVRAGDTVARLGGDEFVAMLEDLSDQELEAVAQTEEIGEKILSILNQSYQLGTHLYHSSASIGATLFSGYQVTIDELIKQADIAMYQAKKAGRNTLRFFDPQMQSSVNAYAALEAELRQAIDQHQFHLHYQIQVDSARRPLGAEALIRWQHPEYGLKLPAQFISLAEETGLILPIGAWVLETACAQIKAWQTDTLTSGLTLAVNVSAKQFRQTNFVAQIRTAIQLHAINPMLLKLELTESLLLEQIEETISTMNALNELGVQFSLDDFGTGYSSLQYLRKLPLDQLKIDQSFISDIATNLNDEAIVHTIIAMAKNLNLEVLAEGVETEQQFNLLQHNGCTHYQGYLFGEALPIEQFMESLATWSEFSS